MALTLIGLNILCELNGVIDVTRAVERHNHRQLFTREGMLRTPAVFRHDEKLRLFRDRQPRHLGDFLRGLRHDGRIQMKLLIPEGVAKRSFFFFATKITTLRLQFFQHGFIDAIKQYH